jgi:hypothetical protein
MNHMHINREIADRISDRIIEVVNSELASMRAANDIRPSTLFAGQLLGLLGYLQSSPQENRPESLIALEFAARTCLREILAASERIQ